MSSTVPIRSDRNAPSVDAKHRRDLLRSARRRAWTRALAFALTFVAFAVSISGDLRADVNPPGGDEPDPDAWPVPTPPTPPEPLVPPDLPIIPTPGPSAYLEGSGGVTSTGEYRYDIPIRVSPGRAGMQPQLALSYSSRGSDGLLGVGWSLSGLSEIHRCATIYATSPDQNRHADGPSYADDDALCLDGNKLISVGPDEFRTERETFARIIRHPTYDDHDLVTQRFTVYGRDGRIREYEPIAMVDPLGGPTDLVWPIHEERDRADNTITYAYDIQTSGDSFSYGIHTIAYPGGHLTFTYVDRYRPTHSWTSGIDRVTAKQLTRIEQSSTTPDVWHYVLEYSPSALTSRPLLDGVQLCASTTCTQTKRFDYDQTSPTFTAADYPQIHQPFAFFNATEADVAAMDADGNGLDDLVYPMGLDLEYALGTCLQLFEPSNNGAPPLHHEVCQAMIEAGSVTIPVDTDGDGKVEVVLFPATGGVFADGFRLYRFDPASETLVPAPFPSLQFTDGGVPQVFQLNWVGYNAPSINAEAPYFADLDGDGLPDLVRAEASFWTDEYSIVHAVTPHLKVFRNDPDDPGVFKAPFEPLPTLLDGFGTGLANRGGRAFDRFREHRAALHITDAGKANSPTGAMTLYQNDQGTIVSHTETPCSNVSDANHEVKIDINGDGLRDRLCIRPIGGDICINRGGSTWNACEPYSFLPGSDGPGTQFAGADINGDGAEELVVTRKVDHTISAYGAWPIGNGTWAWSETVDIDIADALIQVNRVGDYNGDGRLDFGVVLGGQASIMTPLRLYLQDPSSPDALLDVSDEGNKFLSEKIVYERWQPPGAPQTDCAYPQRCAKRGELMVVRERETVNPRQLPLGGATVVINEPERALYAYEGPRVDMQGRGFTGFSAVRTWYPQRPMQVTAKYQNDYAVNTVYPFADVPAEVTTIVPILDVPPEGWIAGGPTTASARVTTVATSYAPKWGELNLTHWVYPWLSRSLECERPVNIHWDESEWDHIVGMESRPCTEGAVLRERTRRWFYDDFGNVTKVAVDTTGGTSSEIETRFDNRVADWLLGLPLLRYERSAVAVNAPFKTRTTSFQHDERGLLSEMVLEPGADPSLTQTIQYRRNAQGLVTSVRQKVAGELPRHVYIDYGSSGGRFPEVVWNDLGHARWAQYEPARGVPTVTRENMVVTQWVHDELGRPREVRPDSGAIVSTTPSLRADILGLLLGARVTTSAETGEEAEVLYDQIGRPVQQRHRGYDGAWIVAETSYDALKRPYFQTRPGVGAPAAEHTVLHFDTLDRPRREERPDGTVVEYDSTFFTRVTTDPDLHKSIHEQDVDGRASRTGWYDTATAQYVYTTFNYEEFDLFESVTDPYSNTMSVAYDIRGRRLLIDDPDAGLTTTTYNGFGEPVTVTDAANMQTTYVRDRAGRVTWVDSQTDGVTQFFWDLTPNGIGQLGESLSPDLTKTTHSYDDLGRLEATTWTVASESFKARRTYDEFSRLSTIQYPEVPGSALARFETQYDYNQVGYLQSIRDLSDPSGGELWSVSKRRPDGALAAAVYGQPGIGQLGNTLVLERSYYADNGRLERIHAYINDPLAPPDPPAPLFDVTYRYHDDGQVAKRTEQFDGKTLQERAETFEYDGAHRLRDWQLSVTAPGPQLVAQHSTTYGYDVIGNIRDVLVDGQIVAHNTYPQNGGARPHALTGETISGVIFDYDDRGRMFADGSRTIDEYTNFDLPKSITTAAGTTDFSYDAHGARVRKAGPNGNTTVLIGGLYERRTSLSAATQHIFRVSGPDGPVAEVVHDEASDKRTPRYIVPDALGSVSVTTDISGPPERFYFDPFGKRIDTTGAPWGAVGTTLHGFTGHRHDDELGLIDMRGRVYDPAMRRFLTPDPIVAVPQFGQSYNRYSYVFNNPVNLTDPSGYGPEMAAGFFAGPVGTFATFAAGFILAVATDGPESAPKRPDPIVATDGERFSEFGCPLSAGGTAHGPCPPGGMGAVGCSLASRITGLPDRTGVPELDAVNAAVEGPIEVGTEMLESAVAMGGKLVQNPKAVDSAMEAAIREAYARDGAPGVANIANPLYVIGIAGADAYLAFERGDLRGFTKTTSKGLTVIAMTIIPDAIAADAAIALTGAGNNVRMVNPRALRPTHLPDSRSKVVRLAKSMKPPKGGFDMTKPLTLVEVDGVLYVRDGHHRRLAAIEARLKEVPATVRPPYSPEEAAELFRDWAATLGEADRGF